LSDAQWENRQLREDNFYANYRSRPVVVYRDHYSSFFWWWLLDRSIEQQAMWAYCHRADMDEARYNALLAHDARLAVEIERLKVRGVRPDSDYVLTGMDEDLQYDRNYVHAAMNPQ